NSGHKDCDVQYAELDTAALASSPSPRSSAHTGSGDLVKLGSNQKSC
uniref:Si:ch211-129p13.1 n=1 Tax=Cyprinodon variegatus TaxID=28743 RepID=A0A3Q2FCC6_CYPVA